MQIGAPGVINGRSKKKERERKPVNIHVHFYERRQARAKNRKGASRPRKKKKSSYYIIITHSLALALGIGKGSFCRKQKLRCKTSPKAALLRSVFSPLMANECFSSSNREFSFHFVFGFCFLVFLTTTADDLS